MCHYLEKEKFIMDLNNLFGILASIASIVASIVTTMFTVKSKKHNKLNTNGKLSKTNNAYGRNDIKIINKESIRDKPTQDDIATVVDKSPIVPELHISTTYTHTSISSKSNDDSFNVIFFGFIILFLGGTIIKFYLDNRSEIIFGIIVLGLLGLLVSIICVYDLYKNNLISPLKAFIEIIKWSPLFIGIILVYKPIYNSENLSLVTDLLKSGTNFLSIFFEHSSETIFFLLQILGLFLMALSFTISLIFTLRNTHKALRTNTYLDKISKSNVIIYLVFLSFIFFFVGGLYVIFINILLY